MDAGPRPALCGITGNMTYFGKLTDDLLLRGRLGLFGRLFRFSHGVMGRWEDVFTPLPLRDVNFLPTYTVVEDSPLFNSLDTEKYPSEIIIDIRVVVISF